MLPARPWTNLSKFLGLGYPGGPIIDRLSRHGDPSRFPFSIPKISDGSLDFSFSGFKTAALRHIEQSGNQAQATPAARSPRKSWTWLPATRRPSSRRSAFKPRGRRPLVSPRSILLVGGVACNSLLRKTFKESFENEGPPRKNRSSDASGLPCVLPGPRFHHRQCRHDRSGRHPETAATSPPATGPQRLCRPSPLLKRPHLFCLSFVRKYS